MAPGDGQFIHPEGIHVDSKCDVWVIDRNNNRVEEFNEAGEYITQFGSTGTGTGQFSFGANTGITTDTKGDIWVTDTQDNRVEEWTH